MDAPELSLNLPSEGLCARQPFWRRPDPSAGIALAAGAGILAAEQIDVAPWTALGLLLILALAWERRRRLPVTWLLIAAAFGTLHAFHLHPVPAETLARGLPSSPNAPARRVRATGAVIDEPRFSANGARFTFGLERIALDGRAWPCQARVTVHWKNGDPVCGDRLELTGAARNLTPPRNPGEFDYADYERRLGICSEIRCAGVTDVRRLSRESRAGLRRTAVRFHDWMRDSLGRGLGPGEPGAAIISTMLLGLKDDPGLGELEELFQRTGTLHYFAIDGLKLALLSCLALWLMEHLGMPRMLARTLSLPPLVFYAMATGLGPASVRATLMGGILLGAFWLERPVRPLNSLGAAAWLILLFDTNQLFDLGFQLTFTVVLAIILWVGPLHRRLLPFGAPDPFLPPRLFSRTRRVGETARRWTVGLVSVSLVAWAGSLPIMILRFHVISPISPLANVVTFPMAWGVLALGVGALCAAALPGGGALAGGINGCNLLAAKLFLATAQFFDAAPFGSFYVPAPSQWTSGGAPAAEVDALDLGIARAIHLRAGAGDWLVDAGQPFEYARSVRPYLHARGVNRLDGFILSQADTHHVGAASLAFAEFRPPRVIDSSPLLGRSSRRQEFLEVLDAAGRRPEIVEPGASVRLSTQAELRVFYPPPGLKAGAAADRALVMQVRAAGWRVLLMANASETAHQWLLANAPAQELRSDAVVSGAAPDQWADFARAVGARLVVSQSGGSGNPRGVTVLRTAESGAIRLRLWPDRMEADGFADGARSVIRRD